MSKYESMYILKPDLEEEKRVELIERFKNVVAEMGGTVEKVDEWGKRRLAYPINYINDGYYVLMYFEAEGTVPAELERRYKISDDVLRFIVVNLDNE